MFGKKIERTIGVDGMHCEHCAKHVEEALKGIPDVKKVSVSLERKEASILSSKPISDESIKAALDEAGFSMRNL